MTRVRIAHMAGPTATIQNTPPLVTSDKARARAGMPVSGLKYDALRAQKLAAPVKVYVEQYSAHPLEKDAAEYYGPPDGYMTAAGFSTEKTSDADVPVYEIELTPEDGLYPLPYMAMQADGSPWDEECTVPGGEKARQGFFPDGSRSFDEIDRLQVGVDGTSGLISALADVDFYRPAPPGGWRNGLPEADRSDTGEGDIPPEAMGKDFYAYKPYHLAMSPPRPMLAKITNDVQAIADNPEYDGLVWTQGSPQVEESAYWFNLLIDTDKPISCNAAQRPQGQISADGPANIYDSVRYIASGIWKDGAGGNRCGTVVIQEQQMFAAREVQKVDARPGGYVATGGHGGIIGQLTHHGVPYVTYLPAYKYCATSDLTLAKLPDVVKAAQMDDSGAVSVIDCPVKEGGKLLASAIPSVAIIKDGGYGAEEFGDDEAGEAELAFTIRHKMSLGRPAGFIIEGLVPYGMATSELRMKMLRRAIYCGAPVVKTGRAAMEGFADVDGLTIAGLNLTATKARLLLMACLLKLGSLPVAADPANPTEAEKAATAGAVAAFQALFDTH
ncbi:MAG: asparaginase [Rhodobacteraceae bacterium]|nr:asparaginase [Paracoccaceae bacterium]